MIDYTLYKETIKSAATAAQSAATVAEALEIYSAGMAAALQVAMSTAVVNTAVTTAGSAVAQTGTGVGKIT